MTVAVNLKKSVSGFFDRDMKHPTTNPENAVFFS